VQSLTYAVPSNTVVGEQALLLNDVSGFFKPGEVTALVRRAPVHMMTRYAARRQTFAHARPRLTQMGPSGSGKTTLLDVLAGRKTVGTTTGTLLFSGQKPSRAFLRRFTGYVEQFDTLLGILTVEEMLLYTAEMKRPITESLASKQNAVEEVLDCLALTSCRDVKIGNPLTKGISGGQAKRVNIGIAIITNPRVLFLDGAAARRRRGSRRHARHARRACVLRALRARHAAHAPGRAVHACTHVHACAMHTHHSRTDAAHALTPARLPRARPRRADVRAG
jgi:ATP-binding cassette subfamily G (WHITE) protein 2